jgi:membrane protein
MLVLVVAVVGLIAGRDAVVAALRAQYLSLFGEQGQGFFDTLLASTTQPATGVVATVLAVAGILFGATSLFAQLHDALNQIWRTPPRLSSSVLDFLRTRLLSLAAVLGLGFLLLVSLVVSAALSGLSTWLHGAAQTGLWRALELGISLTITAGLFAMIFRFLPDVRVAWRDVWVGSLVTAVLFTAGKWAIGVYLGASAIASTYGAAGALAVILVWVYYSSMVLLWGAEFTAVHALDHGRFPTPPPGIPAGLPPLAHP